MKPQEYKQKYDSMNLSEWMLYHQRNIHFKMKYHGLDMQKIPTDLVVYSEIIYDVQPDTIIEIGSAGGGTALWLCHQLDILGKGKVVSVDMNQGNNKCEHKRLTKINGKSQDESVVNKVLEEAEGVCLIIHDGSHRRDDIIKDFENYKNLVTEGSYFIVEDGVMDVFGWKDHRTSDTECGLIAAQKIALQYHSEGWYIDKDREKYIITNNPSGFLRKGK